MVSARHLCGTEGWTRQMWLYLLDQSLTSERHYSNDYFNCIAMKDKQVTIKWLISCSG